MLITPHPCTINLTPWKGTDVEARESRPPDIHRTRSKHPKSTTVPSGAHKGVGIKVAEFLELDTGDSYRAVEGDGPSTAEPLPLEGEMGTGHVHKAADKTTMEEPGGRRVSIAGPTAGEDVGAVSGAGAEHQYANDTTGEARFGTIPGATSKSHVHRGTGT